MPPVCGLGRRYVLSPNRPRSLPERERALVERCGEDIDDKLAPALCAMSATAAMSITSSVGFVARSRKRPWCFLDRFFHARDRSR